MKGSKERFGATCRFRETHNLAVKPDVKSYMPLEALTPTNARIVRLLMHDDKFPPDFLKNDVTCNASKKPGVVGVGFSRVLRYTIVNLILFALPSFKFYYLVASPLPPRSHWLFPSANRLPFLLVLNRKRESANRPSC